MIFVDVVKEETSSRLVTALFTFHSLLVEARQWGLVEQHGVCHCAEHLLW